MPSLVLGRLHRSSADGNTFKIVVLAREEIVLHNAVAIRRIGELEAENLGVLLRLLESVAGLRVEDLRLHDRYRKIAAVPKEAVQKVFAAVGPAGAGDPGC